jgi:type I restriction enzyme S subunit
MDFLIENFKHLTTTPQNVEQLKKLVLQLAVQGKLTAKWREKNPNVEHASALLEKIKAEKKQLIKEGEIRREKPFPKITDNEKVFELPDEWEWVRLVDYGITNTGTTPSKDNPEYFGNDYPFVKPAEISLKGIKYDTEDGLTELGLQQGRLIPKNSVLMVCIGGSIGKSYFTDRVVSCNQQINTISPLLGISSEFLHYFLQSDYFQKAVWTNASGATTPIVNKGKWEQIAIPMPPFDEQKEIVSTVATLFAEIDQLHDITQKKIALRENVAKALFGKINNPVKGEDIQQTWQLVTTNFKTLTQSKESVKQLRQSILQLAVQGKLTAKWREENPNVELASVLLEKIKTENERIKKSYNLRNQKPLLKISDNEIPFEIPESWAWCRLSDIAEIIMGQSPESHTYNKIGQGLPFYQGKKDFGSVYPAGVSVWCTEPTRIANKNDILISVRAPVGDVNIAKETCAIGRGLSIIRLYEINSLLFIFSFLDYFKRIWTTKGSFFDSINKDHVYNLVLPQPPLEEQKEIVTIVNQLMSLCDELEMKIEKRDSYQERIMQAIVKQAFTVKNQTINT